jgi:hypothetical protein
MAGLETVLLLKHAARAIQLAEEFSVEDIEKRFLDSLSQGRSNLSEMGDGLQIYQRFVKPKQVIPEQAVNQYAIASLFGDGEREKKIFSFRVETIDEERREKDDRLLLLGKVRVISEIIPEFKEFIFGLISSPGYLLQNWISEDRGKLDFDALKRKVTEGLEKGMDELRGALAALIGNRVFTLGDILEERKEEVFRKIIEKEIRESLQGYAEIFEKTRPTMEILTAEGLKIPDEVRAAAEITLSHRLYQAVTELKKGFQSAAAKDAIDRIIGEAKKFGCRLRNEEPLRILNEALREKMAWLRRTSYSDLSAQEGFIGEMIALLDLARTWNFDLDRWEAQDLMDGILDECVKAMEESWWGNGVPKPFPPVLLTLAEKLDFNIEKISGPIRSQK